MTNLVLNSQTAEQIQKFIIKPSHALLLEAPAGSGKGSLASYIASESLSIDPNKLESYPFFSRILPVNKVITIDVIREVQKFMYLRTIGKGSIRRVLIIEDAQAMTIEAQNALLKLLEEPPADTVVILTCPPNQSLLPTIYSRTQKIAVKTPSQSLVTTYFSNLGFQPDAIKRAYYLSEGQTGLLQALLSEDAEHSLNNSIALAKKLVTSTVFERLAEVDRLAKQKEQLPELLNALEKVYRSVMVSSSERDNQVQMKSSHQALKRIVEAQSRLGSNPNPKLLLCDLFLNI